MLLGTSLMGFVRTFTISLDGGAGVEWGWGDGSDAGRLLGLVGHMLHRVVIANETFLIATRSDPQRRSTDVSLWKAEHLLQSIEVPANSTSLQPISCILLPLLLAPSHTSLSLRAPGLCHADIANIRITPPPGGRL